MHSQQPKRETKRKIKQYNFDDADFYHERIMQESTFIFTRFIFEKVDFWVLRQ